MKAKNWKKFVSGDKKESSAPQISNSASSEIEEKEKESLLERLVSENETLSRLMEERKRLERDMAGLTGNSVNSDFARNFHFAEIPSISEKRKEEQERFQKLRELKLRRSLSGNSQEDVVEPASSGLSDLSSAAPTDIIGKRSSALGSREKQALRDLDERRRRLKEVQNDIDRASSKVKRTKSDLRQVKGQLESFGKQLDSLSSDPNVREALGDTGINELTGVSKFTGKLDKFTSKLDKPLAASKTNKSATAFVDRWQKIKDKQFSVNHLKEKYHEKSDRILKVKVGTLSEFSAKRDKIQKALAEKKKMDREKQKEREGQKEEQLNSRKEERKADEKREAQRETQRENRLDEKQQEKKQEEEREKQLEERKAARRRDQREQQREERRKERRAQLRNEK